MNRRTAGKMRYGIAVLLAFLLAMSSFVSYAKSSMTLEPTEKVVYQNIEADTILTAYDFDASGSERLFNGKNYVVWGKLTAFSSNHTTLYITDLDGESGLTLICTAKQRINGLEDLEAGAPVKVYGKVVINTWPEQSLSLTVQRVELAVGSPASMSTYSLLDGTTRSKDSMKERTIGDRDFVYYIPEAWTAVEYSLPNVPGYQYKLNNLSGKGTAESLFLFYVDSSYLNRPGDIGKTDQVQKAIIRNILKNNNLSIRPDYSILDSDIRSSVIHADYCDFDAYSGWYQDPNHHNYRVEFLFLPASGDGVRVLLYVYNTGDHVNDILFLLRMMGG